MNSQSRPVYHLTMTDMDILYKLESVSRESMRTPAVIYRNKMISSLMEAVFYHICSVMSRDGRVDDASSPTDSSQILFRHFIEELENNGGIERSSGYYAERLHVSAKHLNAVVRKVSGESAQAWTQKHSAGMISHDLKYSDKSIKEIAYNYGFPSLPSFYKFVKRLLGVSPTEYRNASRE